jgi:ubiquinone/menaquinone biosynthesis C-methylase UbiE
LTSQKEYFDNAALRYSSNAVLVPSASNFRNIVLDKAMRKALTPVLTRFQGLIILEVGCGIGRWMKIMAERNSVIGVDVSRFMVKLARSVCRGECCSFVVADVSFLPFRESAFDLIVSITVLQHLTVEKQLVGALSEIERCGKSRTLIVEEMWSAREILLQRIYCPIRILPLKSYIRELCAVGLRPLLFWGITPAILAVKLTFLLASRSKLIESNFIDRVKSSKMLSKVTHFVMAMVTLSSVLAPVGDYNPCFSLHTVLIAEKSTKKEI